MDKYLTVYTILYIINSYQRPFYVSMVEDKYYLI